MKNKLHSNSTLLIGSLLLAATSLPTVALPQDSEATIARTHAKGMAVAYPWAFSKGTKTARTTAIKTVEELIRRANYASVPGTTAASAWSATGYQMPVAGRMPTRAALKAYGAKTRANQILYGSVTWRTRSIWVNLGPKTISTATVNAYVYDVRQNKVVFRNRNVTGRSDEKSNGYKVAAAVLLTPVVTAVSGGPATPQEQRAVQIALGLAFRAWVTPYLSIR